MKYIIPSSTLKVLEEEDFELLFGVYVYNNHITGPRNNSTFNGWMVEAEDSFDLYCAIKYGRKCVISIGDNEIYQLSLDNAVFFDKERGQLICERFYEKYDK